MKLINNGLRQTGRTARMLEHAKKIAEQHNKNVYVVFYHQAEIDQLKNSLNSLDYSRLILKRLNQMNDIVDPITLKVLDKSLEDFIFIDHGVIESKFPALVRILHQYDQTIHFHMEDIIGISVNYSIGMNDDDQILNLQFK